MNRFLLLEKEKGVFERRHTREPADSIAPVNASILSSSAGRAKIGFVSLSAGAGATTLAFAAAEYLAALQKKQKPRRAVSMLELDLREDTFAGRPYDKIGIDRRFSGRNFVSHYRCAAENKPLNGILNIDGGVNWALRIPGESLPAPAVTTLHRILHNTAGDILICDVSPQGFLGANAAADREGLLSILADMTRLICVLDPLPSRLLASVPAAEICRAAAAAGVPTTYVFNKLNAGVNLYEATRFTAIKTYIPFPAIPHHTVYKSEYACQSLAAIPEAGAALAKILAG